VNTGEIDGKTLFSAREINGSSKLYLVDYDRELLTPEIAKKLIETGEAKEYKVPHL